ncbi:MAG: J domain-containing protein, partial [Spirochaetaceae bacterium]|nr:J domain-containing protein [Spirochaetaceae bacterium]
LVDRRIIVLSDLGPALFDLLRSIGRQEGALPGIAADDQGPGPWAAAGAPGGIEDDRAAALALFELRPSHPSRTEVQSRYRRLMRRFHPDINPDGLDMAKRINAAYAVLITGEGLR